VPHAGYIFSGQICADGFKQVANQKFDFVVILGTKHTNSNIEKVSLYAGNGFRTPLGTSLVEKNIIHSLKKADPTDCMLDKSLHESEHSIEVMVPFIQVVFPKTKIVPVVVGAQDIQTCIRFGQALAKILKNKNALIIASSDLSHYPSAADANMVDRETLSAIASKYGVSVENIKKWNNLSSDKLSIGQKLTINPTTQTSSKTAKQQMHTVKNGETLSSIANKYNTTVDAIMKANNLNQLKFM